MNNQIPGGSELDKCVHRAMSALEQGVRTANIVGSASHGIWRNSAMNRPEILDAAKACVCGQREQDYGTPEKGK